MYTTAKDGYSRGYKTISENAKVPPERIGRRVMYRLEEIGVIAEDRKILISKEEFKTREEVAI